MHPACQANPDNFIKPLNQAHAAAEVPLSLGSISDVHPDTWVLDTASLAAAVQGYPWLIPQKNPEGVGHSYWAFACRLAEGLPFTWQDFKRKYLEFGGDGFYDAWALSYMEPALRGKQFADYQTQVFAPGLCPVAEKLQLRLMQFKTNYTQLDRQTKAADAIVKTIAFLSRS